MNKELPPPVALVLDPAFGVRLEPLAQRAAVWIVNSPTNDEVVERLWGQGRTHITTYKPCEPHIPERCGPSMIETIELHHGSYSWDPPYRRLEVYGSPLTDDFRRMLIDYGFDQFEEMPDGFVATKTNPR